MILRALIALWTSVARPMGDHLWQSTVFVVLAAVLAFALRKNQARVRYWVWLAASVKFLIPFSLLIALGSHFATPRVSTPVQVVVYSAVEDFSQPFVGQVMPAISQAPAAAPVSLLHLLPAMVVAVWLVGMVFILLRWVMGWVRISLMVRRASFVGAGPELDALRRLESRLGVRRPIRLVMSADWMEPGIFGILRPVLIWPEGISQHLEGRHVEAILAHEVCHVRRRDNLTAALHMLVEAMFWFHPLVWWMGVRLEEERERACDEEVSLLCNQPHVYAESILKVCKFCSESPLVCVSGITGADLKKRIMQIMAERVVRKLDVGRKLLLLAVGLGVVAVPIVLAQAKAAQRMMLAAVASAPKPVRAWAAAHAVIELEQTPPTGLLAEVQGATEIPSDAKPFAFDVVSIRPADPNDHGRHSSQFTDDGFVVGSQSLEMMLMLQYPDLQPYSSRIVGGADWVRTLTWDIRAKVADSDISAWSKLNHDSSASAKKRQNATIRGMLTDRFKLKTHLEIREDTVYALLVGKDGPKLKPSTSDAPARFTMHGQGHISFERMTVGSIMPFFAQELGHPAIDKTGLTGKYDMTLDWTPTQGAPAAPGGDAAQASDSAAPSLFTAVQEQLGLKLEAQKGPVEHLVIDSAVKPSVDGTELPTSASSVPVALAQEKAPATATAPEKAIKFDVVSIRQNKSGSREMTRQSAADTDNITMTNVPLALVVFYAYWINDPNMIMGVPDWAWTERYDVVAKVAPSDLAAYHALSKQQRAAMLRPVLADRFKLQAHHETKDRAVYALVISKGGPKLKEAQPGEARPHADKANPAGFQKGATIFATGSNQITCEAAEMGDLAVSLSTRGFEALGLGRPVIDKTGLTGRYDFVLQFPPPPAPPSTDGEDAPQESEASLSDALQDQLGLKLQSATAPADYLVIDHMERPSAN